MDTRICVVETTEDLGALAWIAEQVETERLALAAVVGGLPLRPVDLN